MRAIRVVARIPVGREKMALAHQIDAGASPAKFAKGIGSGRPNGSVAPEAGLKKVFRNGDLHKGRRGDRLGRAR